MFDDSYYTNIIYIQRKKVSVHTLSPLQSQSHRYVQRIIGITRAPFLIFLLREVTKYLLVLTSDINTIYVECRK